MPNIGGDGKPIQVLLVEDSPGDVRFWLTTVTLPTHAQGH
jgi:hypothetical protein